MRVEEGDLGEPTRLDHSGAMAQAWPQGAPGVLTLPSGRRIRGGPVRDLSDDADWSLVLTTLPRRAHPGDWVCWPDFGLPLRPAAAQRSLVRAWRRSADERVQVACGGGVGRTGTALAACVVLDGLEPEAAIAYVRREYHPRAVETPWQRRWVAGVPASGARTPRFPGPEGGRSRT